MNIVSDHNLYKIGVRVKVKVCTKGTWVNLLALETFLSVPLAFLILDPLKILFQTSELKHLSFLRWKVMFYEFNKNKIIQ